jgi:hypothetical protein
VWEKYRISQPNAPQIINNKFWKPVLSRFLSLKAGVKNDIKIHETSTKLDAKINAKSTKDQTGAV